MQLLPLVVLCCTSTEETAHSSAGDTLARQSREINLNLTGCQMGFTLPVSADSSQVGQVYSINQVLSSENEGWL